MEPDLIPLIGKKRRGGSLSSGELEYFARMASNGGAHDAQIGAMLMAIAINGMTSQETADITTAYVKSGEKLDWSRLGKVAADKHSTGGVGDKVSIPLTPILAELGLLVPMISGRGLEITGGTLDKLESIPDFRTDLSSEEMTHCLETCGCFISATTSDLCPADKKTYAIRDITSTVDSTPLITASILSKKIAEGAKYLVQDIKVGKAAFYKEENSAEDLAKTMISTAKLNGLTVVALLTKMDQPLGNYIGNSLEIEESVNILRGIHWPEDLMELILELGSNLLKVAGLCPSTEVGKEKMKSTIKDGSALKKFKSMLNQQGVNEKVALDLCNGDISKVLPQATQRTVFKSTENGYVETVDALKVGTVSFKLGSGRKDSTGNIDLSVGCVLHKKPGDPITEGEPWATLHHNCQTLSDQLKDMMNQAIKISSKFVARESIIIKTVD